MNIEEVKYKTLESEQIAHYSTIYAVSSLVIVSVFLRLWLTKPIGVFTIESLILASYVAISFSFLWYMGRESKRRALINKMPSTDILKLCAFVKENTEQATSTGYWHITRDSFNRHAMCKIFGENIASIIPAHDYFSYVLSEKLISVGPVTDKGTDIHSNPLSIQLSEKGQKSLHIYVESTAW